MNTKFAYSNGVTPMKPISGMYNRNYIRLADGRYFIDKLNTFIPLNYATQKDNYEIVKHFGTVCAINLCNGMIYSTSKD